MLEDKLQQLWSGRMPPGKYMVHASFVRVQSNWYPLTMGCHHVTPPSSRQQCWEPSHLFSKYNLVAPLCEMSLFISRIIRVPNIVDFHIEVCQLVFSVSHVPSAQRWNKAKDENTNRIRALYRVLDHVCSIGTGSGSRCWLQMGENISFNVNNIHTHACDGYTANRDPKPCSTAIIRQKGWFSASRSYSVVFGTTTTLKNQVCCCLLCVNLHLELSFPPIYIEPCSFQRLVERWAQWPQTTKQRYALQIQQGQPKIFKPEARLFPG